MNTDFRHFLDHDDEARRDVFAAAAERLDTRPSYVEKDFWVCLALDILYNRLPSDHPRLLFKGGTSLSKAFGLIRRFSEDVDVVVSREDLGFVAEHDPTRRTDLSNKKREALFDKLKAACSTYVHGPLADSVASFLDERCQIVPDSSDPDGQSLLIEYPTSYPDAAIDYVRPSIKLEAGARSAHEPSAPAGVRPYVAEDLPADWSLDVTNLQVLDPKRTYLEKLLILHGAHCGYRDSGRLPNDKDRISRHYYDAAMITGTDVGRAALDDEALLDAVRSHNLVAFKQAWKKFEEAVPGTLRLVPQNELRAVIMRDYHAMQGMMLGKAPAFDWIMEQLRAAEDAINRR